MAEEQKLRSEIDNQYKWRLEDIFASDEKWETSLKEIKEEIPSLASLRKNLFDSGNSLLNFLAKVNAVEEQLGKLYVFAHMRNDEDKTVTKYQDKYDRVKSLLVEYNQTVSFFESELMALPAEKIKQFFREEAGLEIYAHYIDDITRMREHILSAGEERILALAGEIKQAPAAIFSTWDNADIEFPIIKDEDDREVRLSNALYGKYQQSSNRRLRKDSYLGLFVPYKTHRNTLAASYSSIVKSHIFNARARNYSSTLQAALDTNNIPVDVYHTLIKTARDNVDTLQRYVALRKKILKLDDAVYDYDLRAPLFESDNKDYSWEQALDFCLDGAEILGNDYQNQLKKAFDNNWIDVYENKGKRSGAYSSGTYGVHPYVLMNYNGTLNDIFTLAHEMGHAMHTWYTINNQPFIYGDYPIFLAEVASTTNEILLENKLIEKAKDKKEKLALLNSALDKYNSTFFRQVIFAEFELRSHQLAEEGQALTADKLDDLFGSIYKDYYGPEFSLLRENKALWSRVPHFYYNYYVFQYSTSFVASAALVNKFIDEGEPATARYLNFLKSGRSKYPMETLLDAGIDMHTAAPVKNAIMLMNRLLDDLEQTIK